MISDVFGMRLVNCEKPIYVFNPHTGEYVQTRCGRCDSCRNAFAKKWVNRLDLECQQHKFCYMVTLTYSDDFLPSLFFSEDMNEVVLNRDPDYRIPLHELIDLCKDEYGEYDDVSLKYLRDRLIHPLGLPCCYSKDISNFCKRFNKFCFSHVTHHYENIRYFFCHEYGPTTYRFHVHGLLWFDEPLIAARFQEILSSVWTFGNSDGDAVYSHGGRSYVAQYVNMSTHLPAFYSHPKLRQKHQFSKCPSIGTYNILDEKVFDIYDRLPIKRTIWNSQASRYDVVPVESAFKSRFFPKCQGYNNLTYSDRVSLYGITNAIPSEDFKEFSDSVNTCEWLALRNIANVDEWKIADFKRQLVLNQKTPDSVRNGLYRLYTISKRIVWFSQMLNTSVSWLVSRIDEFWKLIDYENLKSMYEFQQDYAKDYPISDLVYMYPIFQHDLRFWLGSLKRPLYVNYALQSFGIHFESDLRDYKDTSDYFSMVEKAKKIYKDTHKRQFVNAYRDRKLEMTDSALAAIVREFQVFNFKVI